MKLRHASGQHPQTAPPAAEQGNHPHQWRRPKSSAPIDVHIAVASLSPLEAGNQRVWAIRLCFPFALGSPLPDLDNGQPRIDCDSKPHRDHWQRNISETVAALHEAAAESVRNGRQALAFIFDAGKLPENCTDNERRQWLDSVAALVWELCGILIDEDKATSINAGQVEDLGSRIERFGLLLLTENWQPYIGRETLAYTLPVVARALAFGRKQARGIVGWFDVV